jgi:hypothetical protein
MEIHSIYTRTGRIPSGRTSLTSLGMCAGDDRARTRDFWRDRAPRFNDLQLFPSSLVDPSNIEPFKSISIFGK